MIGIDLFSGAGGMSVGATQCGVEVLISIEKDRYACETYQKNHPDTNCLNTDIREVKKLPKLPCDKEIILFGGPPCQGFSTSNQRTRNRENPNNWLFQEVIRFAKKLRPDWVVIENVRGMVETERAIFPDMIMRALAKLGYTTNSWVLQASEFGIPQNRSRLFIVGNRYGIKLPKPVGDSALVTVRDAISDLPRLANGASEDDLPYSAKSNHPFVKQMKARKRKVTNNLVTRNAKHIVKRYKYVPEGGNWENIPEDLMLNYKDRDRCHTGIYRRLEWNKPSCVIANFRKNMLIHPGQDRGLSVREAARLQSFPDWFYFMGSIGFQQQQVGNAVPPLLAKAVFTQIMQSRELNQKRRVAS